MLALTVHAHHLVSHLAYLCAGLLQELLQKFRERKVDFAAHTQTEDGNAVFFNLIGTLRAAPAPCMPAGPPHPATALHSVNVYLESAE